MSRCSQTGALRASLTVLAQVMGDVRLVGDGVAFRFRVTGVNRQRFERALLGPVHIHR